MPYNPDIPRASDLLNQSQEDIQQNFELANTYFGTDHVEFDATTNNGKHNQSSYVVQGAPPTTGAGASEVILFSRSNSPNTVLWVSPSNNAASYQLTGETPVNGAINVNNSDNSSTLPGGMLLKFGFVRILAGQSTGVVNFSGGNFAAIISITLTPNSAAPSTSTILSATALAVGGFTAVRSAAPATPLVVYYSVMGR